MEDDHEAHALAYLDRIATMSDDEVRDTYERTDGAAGDAWADALTEALKGRSLDD